MPVRNFVLTYLSLSCNWDDRTVLILIRTLKVHQILATLSWKDILNAGLFLMGIIYMMNEKDAADEHLIPRLSAILALLWPWIKSVHTD